MLPDEKIILTAPQYPAASRTENEQQQYLAGQTRNAEMGCAQKE